MLCLDKNYLYNLRNIAIAILRYTPLLPTEKTQNPRFGQPEKALDTQLGKMRYPTMQRVAHTLPKDPKYRSHVVRSIRVPWC